MVRRKYQLTNYTLEWLLYEKRCTRMTGFEALASLRECHLSWLKRKALNNKHTMGTDV